MTTSMDSKKPKRRPGREAEADLSETSSQEVGSSESEDKPPQDSPPPPFHDEPQRKHVDLNFTGADVLKEKAPKIFDLAQTVADEWVNDGSFNDLKLGHPVAEMFASMGLREAKKIEKKLEEKGVFALAKMGLDYAKNRWKK